MKKLLLISDQLPGKTSLIDDALMKILGKDHIKIAYIPSSDDSTKKYFNRKCAYYNEMGIDDVTYFDIHRNYSDDMIDSIMKCDMLHLSGGDTQNFLNRIKEIHFERVIHNFLKMNKLVLGLSAGAIVMSENINILTLPPSEPVDLEASSSLNIVDFDIMPHWNDSLYDINPFLSYSLKERKDVYLLHDGDGIFIHGNTKKFIGNVIKIHNGQVI